MGELVEGVLERNRQKFMVIAVTKFTLQRSELTIET